MPRGSGRNCRHGPDWRILYGAAVTETISARLPGKVKRAELAIATRLEELGNSRKSAAEREALEDARRNLRRLGEARRSLESWA